VEANDTARRTEATGDNVLGAVLERRYRVDAPLARGGMSSVYQGVDLRLDRPVAIKVMEQRFAADRSFIDRFELEARAAARLHHPNVVAVHDQGVDHDQIYLVMELVDGGTLRDLLRAQGATPNPLSVPLAFSILDPMLNALAAAHRAGLVHRDVKPENVLIGRGGTVKVGDFGLVRAIANAGTTSADLILGTVAYLSPEQVATGAADPRSDVYSAGVVLYEMLTGVPPYSADTALSIAYRHVNDDMPPPSEALPGLPPAVDDLVLRATRRDPALRPADADAFLAELAKTRASLGIGPVPVPVPHVARPEPVAFAPTSAVAREDPNETQAYWDPETVRSRPVVGPSPIGPSGTRALSRGEYQHLAGQYGPPQVANQPRQQQPMNGYEAQRTRSRRVFAIWISVILLLAVLIGVGAWWLGSGRWTAIPQVSGLSPTVAEHAIATADLSVVVKQTHDNVIPAGQVINTDPVEGSRALRGASVTLLVSEGRPVVPDVTAGANVDAVEQALRADQLTPHLDPTQSQFSDTVPAGAVISLSPPAGSQVAVNTQITIVVSKGAQPKPIPNVVGQPHDQAFAALTAAGFQPYDLPKQFSGQVQGGLVLSTNPPIGTVIQPGGDKRVGVVVSDAVTVPSMTGEQAGQAVQQLQQLGLQAQVQSLMGGQDQNGTVFQQSVPPNTLVQPGTQITIAVFP
jgi:serine/threonine protein kinase/beta-lactam-binding protein with PASTA domain